MQPRNPAQPQALSQLTGNITRGVDPANASAYTRTVDQATETTSGQLNTLLRGDNPILQRAARKGATLAQLRGSTGNDSLFAGAAQDAMAENLIPVASQDAAVYERGATANMGALNESSIVDRNNAQSGRNAAAAAAASMYGSDKQLQAEMARLRESSNQFKIQQSNLDRQFTEDQRRFAEDTRRYENDNAIRSQERQQNRAWEVADRDTATRAAGRNQIFSQVAGAIFSDPAYWRDPAGATGMLNFFSNNFTSIWDSMFPPTNPGV